MYVHVTINGNSYDILASDLDVGDLSTDTDIKTAVAAHLEQPLSKFSVMRVDRNTETGDITIRPEATFGTVATEEDQRIAIINSLMTTPHRDLMKVYEIHSNLIKNDPLFYVQLAAWYFQNGDIRDHKECFIICLCLSDFNGHRDVGLALLRQLPPYQVMRIVDFINGKEIKEVTKVKQGKKFTYSVTKKKFGLYRNIPRSVKTEIHRYLKERENETPWFDACVTSARKQMKRLYKLFRIPPSTRAQAILFDEQPPEDSTAFLVKELAKLTDPSEQAKLIIEKKIPYRIASSVVTSMTPTVMLALLEVMTDAELINNMGSLKTRGVFDNPELKEVVTKRLDKAKKGKKVSALKSIEAVKASGVTEDLAKQLEDIADSQLKSKGRITRNTAILIDKSQSMNTALEVAKRLGSAISAVMDAKLYVYAFDSMSCGVKVPKKPEFSEWEKALSGLRSGGTTSCGASIVHMIRNKDDVEQIIMVTDEGENARPSFISAIQEYEKTFNHPVRVVFIKVGNSTTQLEQACKIGNIEYETITFNGDYYSIPSMIPFLTKASRLDTLIEIMSYKLPVRKTS